MAISDEDKEQATDVYYMPRDGLFNDYGLTPEQKELSQFMEELKTTDAEAKITVYKQPTDSRGRPTKAKMAFCFEAAPDEYTVSQLLTTLQQDFGRGYYKIQVRDANGQLMKNKTVIIEEPRGDEKESKGNDLVSVMREMQDSMNQNLDRQEHFMRSVALARPSSSFDVDKFATLVTAITPLALPLLNKLFDKPKEKSVGEQMKELILLKEFMQDFSGKDEPDSISGLLTESVKAFGPMFTAAIKASSEKGNVNDDGIIETKQLTQERENVDANLTPEEQLLKKQNEQSIKFLCMQAEAGQPPDAVAEFTIDSVPDEQLDTLEAFLKQPDCIDKTCRLFPRAALHRDWLRQWREHTLQMLDEMLIDDEDGAINGAESSEGHAADPEPDQGADVPDAENDADSNIKGDT